MFHCNLDILSMSSQMVGLSLFVSTNRASPALEFLWRSLPWRKCCYSQFRKSLFDHFVILGLLFLCKFGLYSFIIQILKEYHGQKTSIALNYFMQHCYLQCMKTTISCNFCHILLLSLQIGITPPSFATDGATWHATLAYGCEQIGLSKSYLTLEFSLALRQLSLLQGS